MSLGVTSPHYLWDVSLVVEHESVPGFCYMNGFLCAGSRLFHDHGIFQIIL